MLCKYIGLLVFVLDMLYGVCMCCVFSICVLKQWLLFSDCVCSLRHQPATLRVKAMYDFSAEEKDELDFSSGDIIEVVDQSDPSWWKGRLRGRVGLFPSNYTTPVWSRDSQLIMLSPEEHCYVLFDFNPLSNSYHCCQCCCCCCCYPSPFQSPSQSTLAYICTFVALYFNVSVKCFFFFSEKIVLFRFYAFVRFTAKRCRLLCTVYA